MIKDERGRLQLTEIGMATTGEEMVGTGARRSKRTRLVRPYPVNTLEEALDVAHGIRRTTSGLPIDRSQLAKALGTTPSSSGFTTRLNSAAKYGLTEGAYNAPVISLTRIGEAVTAPREPAERRQALVDAALKPMVLRRFYEMFNGRAVPEDEYAQNLIQRELEVQPSLTAECLQIIKANGELAGILSKSGDALVVDLPPRSPDLAGPGALESAAEAAARADRQPAAARLDHGPAREATTTGGRIFVGHAGPSKALDAIRETLRAFGVAFVESDAALLTGGSPVPPEVARVMRECSSGVLVFTRPGPGGGSEHEGAGPLGYQLGAASVLFGQRVVVLEEAGGQPNAWGTGGVRKVVFDEDRPGELGLELLKALHASGIITVTA